MRSRKTRKKKGEGLKQDLFILAISLIVAFALVRSNAVSDILARVDGNEFAGSFVAGMFFTSAFTTAPAIVTLGEIAQHYSLLFTAVGAGAGAVVGDLLIFSFVRDRFSDHLKAVMGTRSRGRRLKLLFGKRISRWLTFVVGGLILASPLPDEIGVSVMGFSHIALSKFIPISFAFNTMGVLLIGLAARSVGF